MSGLITAVEVGGLYAIVVASLVLSILSVFYAYRLSRITGLFSAWTLLIAGLILTTFEDFAYFGIVIFANYDSVTNQVEAFTPGNFSFLTLILICIPAMFFGAMYQLYGMFKSQSENRVENRPAPITQ